MAAVDRLLKVRQGTVSLKHRIVELNDDIQSAGETLVGKVSSDLELPLPTHLLTFQCLPSQKKALLSTRRTLQNIDEAIETLQTCLRVLDLANRVAGLIESGKYFGALRVSPAPLPNPHYFLVTDTFISLSHRL